VNLVLPRHKRVLPLDFFEARKTVRQTPAEMLRRIEMFNLAMGGRDLRKNKDGDHR